MAAFRPARPQIPADFSGSNHAYFHIERLSQKSIYPRFNHRNIGRAKIDGYYGIAGL
jgi:hypothetical protein